MNATNAMIQTYRRADIEARSGPELLVDLCDGAVRAIEIAQTTDRNSVCRSELNRARRIVAALQEALSFEIGGAVALSLFRHYTYLNRLLIEAEQDPQQAQFGHLHEKLTDLRDTWAEAVNIFEEEYSGITSP